MYTAATVPVEKEGASNPLLESAMQIGEDTASDEEKEKPTAPKEPDVGSYERFMLTFGSPARWSGH